MARRGGRKFANQDVLIGEDDGINPDSDYYGKVFDQLLNLWQTDDAIKSLILDERLGSMAATLAGVERLRVWHDQALIKQPWANPTGFHLDTPFWSFSDRRAISIWIALDDATVENGCLYFFPGSHLATTFANPGITKNLDAIFELYPAYRTADPVRAAMKAGSCSFHNGMTIHGAGSNMTSRARRAMTCAYMPDGAMFNGQQNILDRRAGRLAARRRSPRRRRAEPARGLGAGGRQRRHRNLNRASSPSTPRGGVATVTATTRWSTRWRPRGTTGSRRSCRPAGTRRTRLRRAIERAGLACIAHQYEADGDDATARRQLAENLRRAADLGPELINSHTGRDFWPARPHRSAARRRGHRRGRGWGPGAARDPSQPVPRTRPRSPPSYLERHPDLRLTADLSHWACVSESLLEDQAELLDGALPAPSTPTLESARPSRRRSPTRRSPDGRRELDAHVGWWRQHPRPPRGAGAEVDDDHVRDRAGSLHADRRPHRRAARSTSGPRTVWLR